MNFKSTWNVSFIQYMKYFCLFSSLPVLSGQCVQEDIFLGAYWSCFKHRARLKSTSSYLPRTHGYTEPTSSVFQTKRMERSGWRRGGEGEGGLTCRQSSVLTKLSLVLFLFVSACNRTYSSIFSGRNRRELLHFIFGLFSFTLTRFVKQGWKMKVAQGPKLWYAAFLRSWKTNRLNLPAVHRYWGSLA